MRDPRLNALADVLVQHCAPVHKGNLVCIVADPAAMPAVEAIFEAVLRAGGHPTFHPRSESLQELLLTRGTDDQIRHVSPFEQHRLALCDVLIVLGYTNNTKFLSHIDPAKAAMFQAARRGLLTMGLERLANGSQRYVLTELPSQAAAQQAEMSLAQYTDWVFRAGLLHLPDPVAAWQRLRAQSTLATTYLQGKSTLRFQSPANASGPHQHDGTDLTVDISGGTWLIRSGDSNFPDGEIETGPKSATGVVNFTLPSIYRGKEVTGIRLKFKDGRVVEASATKNEDYLLSLLDQDPGARIIGEIALGTNYHLTQAINNTFFDEKIGGTFHLAVGAGYPDSGNTNQSGLHWDMVSDLRSGGTIHADGELIQSKGRFVFDNWPGPQHFGNEPN